MLERSRVLMGSTPMPLPVAHAAIRAVTILGREGGAYRERLQGNVRFVRERLRRGGWDVTDTAGPIVSMPVGAGPGVQAIREALLRARIYPPWLRYPGGPKEGQFRFVISSEHSEQQLVRLVGALLQSRDRIA